MTVQVSLPPACSGLQDSFRAVIQHLHRSRNFHFHRTGISSLPGKIRQEGDVRNHVGLLRYGLLHGNFTACRFQNRKQSLFHLLHGQFPDGAVGILHDRKLPHILHRVLGHHAAFQANMPLLIQIHVQIRRHDPEVCLGIGGADRFQVIVLGKAHRNIPGQELSLFAEVNHMYIGSSPEQYPVTQHPAFGHLRADGAADQFGRNRAGLGQYQLLIQLKSLLPCLRREPDRVGILQQLHVLRQFRGTVGFPLVLHQSLPQRRYPGPDHDFSGGYGTGIHKPGQAQHPDLSIRCSRRKIPGSLPGNPAADTADLCPILRCIQHPYHHPAGYGKTVAAPFFAAQDGLSPGTQHPSDIRHSVGDLQFLGLLLGLHLMYCRTHPAKGLLLKLQFQFGSLLVPWLLLQYIRSGPGI